MRLLTLVTPKSWAPADRQAPSVETGAEQVFPGRYMIEFAGTDPTGNTENINASVNMDSVGCQRHCMIPAMRRPLLHQGIEFFQVLRPSRIRPARPSCRGRLSLSGNAFAKFPRLDIRCQQYAASPPATNGGPNPHLGGGARAGLHGGGEDQAHERLQAVALLGRPPVDDPLGRGTHEGRVICGEDAAAEGNALNYVVNINRATA